VPAPQPGIFVEGARHHHHLEFDIVAGGPLPALPRVAGVDLVVGFAPALWRRLAADDAPPWGAYPGSAQHDVWLWLHGGGPDDQLDLARALVAALRPVATLAAEQQCFLYHDNRDTTGFIDGTENPPVSEAPEVALVPEGSMGEGGSYALTMRWVHDLDSFHALPIDEQEAVFGRTKPDSVELDPLPETSHVGRVVIEDDGEELEIYRRSAPFGTAEEAGLYFVAFSADPTRFDRMLGRMFGTDGPRDRLLDFSTPVSGAHYFVPSLDALERVPKV
jgi:putative iron-dependent peroxidase